MSRVAVISLNFYHFRSLYLSFDEGTFYRYCLNVSKNFPNTYYLRDLFVAFPCDVELTVAAPITPAASSLLDGFVSPPLLSGGSFLFSKEMYSANY